jgi:hypothetical protein
MSREINRTALIVTPKQPFVDWLLALDPTGGLTLAEAREDTTVFLVPDQASDEGQEQVLKEYWEEIFERILWEWYTDEGDWPQDRTYEKFRAWFDVRYHSGVVDLGKGQIKKVG